MQLKYNLLKNPNIFFTNMEYGNDMETNMEILIEY